jgi:hypothetical protein
MNPGAWTTSDIRHSAHGPDNERLPVAVVAGD